jgi:hypothetical protein
MAIFNGKTARDVANETSKGEEEKLTWETFSYLDLPVAAAKEMDLMFEANERLRKILDEAVRLPDGFNSDTHEVKYALPIRKGASKSIGVAFVEKKRKGPTVTFKK